MIWVHGIFCPTREVSGMNIKNYIILIVLCTVADARCDMSGIASQVRPLFSLLFVLISLHMTISMKRSELMVLSPFLSPLTSCNA